MEIDHVAVRLFAPKNIGGVILLHGLGAYATDISPHLETLPKAIRKKISFIVPQAPSKPVTLNRGAETPTWFDILALGEAQPEEDWKGLEQTRQAVLKLIDEFGLKGVERGQIVVGGFSQGGAAALYSLMQDPDEFLGGFALSGYLPRGVVIPDNNGMPVLLTHGVADDVIPIGDVRSMPESLSRAGYKVQWHEMQNLGHSINKETVDILAEWLREVFQL